MTNDTPRPAPKMAAAREILSASAFRGLTWRDYAAMTGAHHGSASGMLSRLHRNGDALRLVERRDGCAIYVAPDFRGERDIVPVRVRRAPAAPAAEGPDLEAFRREAYAEGSAAGRAHEREMAERRRAEQDEVARLSGYAAGRVDGLVEGKKVGMADLAATVAVARLKAYEEGLAKGREEVPPPVDVEEARAAGYAAGRAHAEAEWQAGYDEGAKVGAVEAVKELKRKLADAGGEPFYKGREVGRREGEEVARRHVAKVAGELFRTISESAPVRTHHGTCYKQHADCAVKSVAASLGVPVARLKNEHAA